MLCSGRRGAVILQFLYGKFFLFINPGASEANLGYTKIISILSSYTGMTTTPLTARMTSWTQPPTTVG